MKDSARIIAKCCLSKLLWVFVGSALSSCSSSGSDPAKTLRKTSNTLQLEQGAPQQYLVPVRVGNKDLKLLLDTGSNALLVFRDKLGEDNSEVKISPTSVRKKYASTLREGHLATAPVTIGEFAAKAMRIMVIDTPHSDNDPSLTPKHADGILGMRRTDGLSEDLDPVPLDAPLAVLEPDVKTVEFVLPMEGEGQLTLGEAPNILSADPTQIFLAKTLAVSSSNDPVHKSYADLQVPFHISSSFGAAEEGDQDILLDSGALSDLTLDIRLAEKLGYDRTAKKWRIPADEELIFHIIGARSAISFEPRFKISEVVVADYRAAGVAFEAVLGISRWHPYVVGFTFVDYQSGGPDGTIQFLPRSSVLPANILPPVSTISEVIPEPGYVAIPGLNSHGHDSFPETDNSGHLITFQSNRNDGRGENDVYVYKRGTGLLSLNGLNSEREDGDPSISGDGRYVAFHSNRRVSGVEDAANDGDDDFNIYVYDLKAKALVELPGLNSTAIDRNPSLSQDGHFLAFRSERHQELPDGCTITRESLGSQIYLYDMKKKALDNSLAPLLCDSDTFAGEKYDPHLNKDGSMLAFEGYGTIQGGDVQRDLVFLWDVQGQIYIPFPFDEKEAAGVAINSAPSLSGDANWLLFTTTRETPDLGLYDRDLVLLDLQRGIERFIPGLNSLTDDHAASLSGDKRYIVFHSEKRGGKGGADVYLYDFGAGVLDE